jgi:uncharacterized protein YjbI with pentapeptide repeats
MQFNILNLPDLNLKDSLLKIENLTQFNIENLTKSNLKNSELKIENLKNSNLKYSKLKIENLLELNIEILSYSNIKNSELKIENLLDISIENFPNRFSNTLTQDENLHRQNESLKLKIYEMQGEISNNELIYFTEKKRLNLKITKLQQGIEFMKKEYKK